MMLVQAFNVDRNVKYHFRYVIKKMVYRNNTVVGQLPSRSYTIIYEG